MGTAVGQLHGSSSSVGTTLLTRGAGVGICVFSVFVLARGVARKYIRPRAQYSSWREVVQFVFDTASWCVHVVRGHPWLWLHN